MCCICGRCSILFVDGEHPEWCFKVRSALEPLYHVLYLDYAFLHLPDFWVPWRFNKWCVCWEYYVWCCDITTHGILVCLTSGLISLRNIEVFGTLGLRILNTVGVETKHTATFLRWNASPTNTSEDHILVCYLFRVALVRKEFPKANDTGGLVFGSKIW